MLDSFFRTHRYLVEHMQASARRGLMDEIDWRHRLIGIKGSRGVGKTTFLLQYARSAFGTGDRRCLYVNMNHFYFQGHGLLDFAGDFVRAGGQVLLIDQVFKRPGWSSELRSVYETYPTLKVVFTGSSVMRLKDENPELNGLVKSYNLRGFSFREYLNLQTGQHLPPCSMQDILDNHERLAREVVAAVNPLDHFRHYLHHGYYPFFLEHTNFSENLLKVMNMMIEVDILLIQQIELKYLSRIKKLFYLLATDTMTAPNVSTLAQDVLTSRATVMNYIKYLSDARLINMLHRVGEAYPKKPAMVSMHNTNLMHVMTPGRVDVQQEMETFFQNALWGRHEVNVGERRGVFVVDRKNHFRILTDDPRRVRPDMLYVRSNILGGRHNMIPLWLFGFLY